MRVSALLALVALLAPLGEMKLTPEVLARAARHKQPPLPWGPLDFKVTGTNRFADHPEVGDVSGYADYQNKELYLAPDLKDPTARRQVLNHEKGHFWAEKHLNPAERAWIGKQLGGSGHWTKAANGRSADGELFAEAVAQIALGNEPYRLTKKGPMRTRGDYGLSMTADARAYVTNLMYLAPGLHAKGQSGA